MTRRSTLLRTVLEAACDEFEVRGWVEGGERGEGEEVGSWLAVLGEACHEFEVRGWGKLRVRRDHG
jgi:hypothetical protein